MKIQIRKTNNDDLKSINDLQHKCFSKTDVWYESMIKNYLQDGYIMEVSKNIHKKAIGVLLHGNITPCSSGILGYNGDVFVPNNDIGNEFINTNQHYKDFHGITMLCIHPTFQKKGFGQKLIEHYHELQKDKILVLNTRITNINAIALYKKMGYNHIGNIKDKYFLPTEDCAFMIKS